MTEGKINIKWVSGAGACITHPHEDQLLSGIIKVLKAQ
jgi:hypothetical protein